MQQVKQTIYVNAVNANNPKNAVHNTQIVFTVTAQNNVIMHAMLYALANNSTLCNKQKAALLAAILQENFDLQ
jgi:S-adenosylhomocysteine hydrolase